MDKAVVPIERVCIAQIMRAMKPGDERLFGRSFSYHSIRVSARNAADHNNGKYKVVEVANGYLCWRKQ